MAEPLQVPGVLEVDPDRGVIYFHTTDPTASRQFGAVTLLRVCGLPKPVPLDRPLDITHMHGCGWAKGEPQ